MIRFWQTSWEKAELFNFYFNLIVFEEGHIIRLHKKEWKRGKIKTKPQNDYASCVSRPGLGTRTTYNHPYRGYCINVWSSLLKSMASSRESAGHTMGTENWRTNLRDIGASSPLIPQQLAQCLVLRRLENCLLIEGMIRPWRKLLGFYYLFIYFCWSILAVLWILQRMEE